MIDIHTHILPGVDDGVETEDEAVAFARVAVADGIRTLVATPHCKDGFAVNERPGVLAAVARLRDRLAAEAVALEVLPGAEVHLCPDLPERVRDGRAPTLADNGRTLLLELSTSQYPVDLESLVFHLKLAGIIPVLAHPERIRYFQDDVRRYESAVRLGAYGQLTAGSLTGTFGEAAQEFSEELLQKRLVHVLASDSHDARDRPPVLSRAAAAVASALGEPEARFLCEEGPGALIDGREPEWPPRSEAPERRRSSWLSRWFRGR